MPYAPAPRPRRGRTALIVGLALVVAVVLTSGLGAVAGYYYWRTSHVAVPFDNFATPTATPSGTIILQDPLTSNIYGWAMDPPYCQFANGGYQVSDRICFAPVGVIGDASISVQVRQIQGIPTHGFGLALRHVSQGNYYLFHIVSDSQWLFGKVVNGSLSPILGWQGSNAIKGGLNATNTLLVRAKGSHFDFYVNNQQVGQADDSTFSSGRTGVDAGASVQSVFNNFTVTIP